MRRGDGSRVSRVPVVTKKLSAEEIITWNSRVFRLPIHENAGSGSTGVDVDPCETGLDDTGVAADGQAKGLEKWGFKKISYGNGVPTAFSFN